MLCIDSTNFWDLKNKTCLILYSLLLPLPYKRPVWHKILWESPRRWIRLCWMQGTPSPPERNPQSCLYLSTCTESTPGDPPEWLSLQWKHTAVESGWSLARPDRIHSSLRDSFHQPLFCQLEVTRLVNPLTENSTWYFTAILNRFSYDITPPSQLNKFNIWSHAELMHVTSWTGLFQSLRYTHS